MTIDFTTTRIKNSTEFTKNFVLEQNYPNPFNPVTNIGFSLAKTTKVKLEVYDILGRRIATLVNTVKEKGKHSIKFNASQLPSGVYFYKITTKEFSNAKKMLLLK